MSAVDQIAAFRATVRLAKKHPWWTMKHGASVEHLERMLEQILADPKMPPDKLGRYLGWAQAVVCLCSPKPYELDDFMEMNRQLKRKKKGRK